MPTIREIYSKIEGRVEDDYNRKIVQLDDLKRMWELLTKFDDGELRILMKNHYYSGRKDRRIWPLICFLDYPEMKADPVFFKLHKLWNRIVEIDKFVDCGLEREHPLMPVYNSLCSLTTKMANREMTEQEYLSLLDNTNPLFKQAQDLVSSLEVLVS